MADYTVTIIIIRCAPENQAKLYDCHCCMNVDVPRTYGQCVNLMTRTTQLTTVGGAQWQRLLLGAMGFLPFDDEDGDDDGD